MSENRLHTKSHPDNTRNAILLRQERSLLIVMLLAVIWALPNLLLAIFSDSLLLLSEVPDNALFIFTNFISWRVLRSIRLGRLHGFDYGTGKVQIVSSFISSAAYIVILMLLGVLSVRRILNPMPLDSDFTTIAVGCQLAIFFTMGWFWRHGKALAAEQASPVMEMQWRTYRADALAALVFATALILWLLLKQYSWAVFIDPISALLFVCYATISFLPVVRHGINDILDKTLQENLQLMIDKRLVQFFHGYDGFHGVRSRHAGERTFIEVALSFAPEQRVSEISETIAQLCESIEQDIVNSEVRVSLVPCLPLNPTDEISQI